jgi:hypothetical protein
MRLLPASVETLLRSACLPGEEWTDVQARIAENTAQVWTGTKSAMLTEIVGSNLHVWLGAGCLRELLRMSPLVEQAGREWGCKRITIDGRQGWQRALERYGYVLSDGILEKTL